MKNVTKILTAVVLCAAVFASTNRIGALGGNAAFWPGDEANITAFPAQVNNHAYLQLSGVAADGDASADMVFNHNGTAWGLSFSDSYDSWVNLKWGKGDMGISFSLMNSTTPGTAAIDAVTVDHPMIPGFDPTPDYTPEVGTADTNNCGDGTMACGNASVDTCSDGVSANQAACEAAVAVPGSCSDGVSADQVTCEAVADCNADGTADDACVWTPDTFHTWGGAWEAQVGHPGTDDTPAWTETISEAVAAVEELTADGWKIGYGNVFDFGEIGFHLDDIGNMDIHFRKACGFWVFTDMVGHLSMPDATGMELSADWFTHWDASGADVMFAMGMEYNEDMASLTQTAAVGVEANMTDWASFRAGITWDYQLSGDDDVVGNTDYTWNTGLGFNWGGFTADMSVSDGILANPVGYTTGYAGALTDAAIQLTYSF